MRVTAVCFIFLQLFISGTHAAAGDQCTSGACTSPLICDTDDNCKNAIGASCTPSGPAHCPVNAECTGNSGSETCTCSGDFEQDDVHCKASAGQACDESANPAIYCVADHTCHESVCKANTGQACDTSAGASPQVPCTAGHTCDNSVCKINQGGACTGTSDTNCVTHASCTGTDPYSCTCDDNYAADGDVCKAAPGASCDGATNPCKTGYTCDSTCKGDAGSACESTTPIECATDLTCDNDVCKAAAGKTCDATDNPCETGYTCDTTCKGEAGSACESTTPIVCATDLTCDNDVCKIKAGADCTGNIYGCVKGAACQTSGSSTTCTCVTDVSTLNSGSGTCTPNANKIGGTCSASSCEDPQATCSQTCTCGATYVVDPSDLTCGFDVDGDCSNDATVCIAGTVCESGTCKKAVGAACTGTGTAAKCPANADCASGKCTCNPNYSESGGKCRSTGAGLAVSSLLMLLALITTRL